MTTHTSEADFPIVIVNNYPVMQMPPRLTILEAVTFKQVCHELLATSPLPSQLIIDFSKTQFMDSSGVGALVHNYKSAKTKNVQLILYNIHPPVMAVLSMTGLDEVFPITSTLDTQQKTTASNTHGQPPETHPSVRSWVKRLIDIIGSLVGLVIIGVLFIPIAIAIKRDSPGPIFFQQIRCGWMGKRFKIIKFRSMCVDAEAQKHKIPNQAQGAILKIRMIHELPDLGSFYGAQVWMNYPNFVMYLKGT